MEIQFTLDFWHFVVIAAVAATVLTIWIRSPVRMSDMKDLSHVSIMRTYLGSIFSSAIGLVIIAGLLLLARW